ncbi:MAG TPA: NAD(P)/FAD-dependent oxidoreductase [Egibacteraceae bacterium]|nr:NAD(P)/FAD-dependent oxidoreductase [Egibacteraceae bacterium]
MYDAIVIGGGSAGLAATTWLARYRRRVLLVDGGEPRNRWVDESHGYLGSDPMNPNTLLERARHDLAAYSTVEMLEGKASSAAAEPRGGFAVEVDGKCHLGGRLVLATGVVDAFPDVDGFFTHYGADVFHCPTCDGYQAQDLPVVAFGWDPAVAGFALELLDWAKSVTVVTNGQPFEGNGPERDALTRHGVELVEDKADALLGARGELEGVRLRSGSELECRLAFFSIAHHPVTGLAEQLGCALDGDGYVVVDEQGETSVPGVYAAGDLTPGMQLVQVAAAKGALAGTSCALSLRGEEGAPDNRPPGPDVEQELHGG